MTAHATGLVRRFLDAASRVEDLIKVNEFGPNVDEAIAEEVEAQAALLQQVKLATRQCLSRPVPRPVSAFIDGVMVVVAPDDSHTWNEIVVVVEKRDIAFGE